MRVKGYSYRRGGKVVRVGGYTKGSTRKASPAGRKRQGKGTGERPLPTAARGNGGWYVRERHAKTGRTRSVAYVPGKRPGSMVKRIVRQDT